MMEINTDNVRSQMRKGVLEYCILSILDKKEAYASSIIEELKGANMIVVDQGSLTYRWEESPQGPPRKYYCISEAGRVLLKEMDASWTDLVETINTLKHNDGRTES